ncbi:MAG: RNA methyltransferase [Pseudomonadota bacterium]|nr:RNA methyltransferase [Pseudomonadota bacterium]
MVPGVVSSIVPPVIILVEPTLGENIGAAARAMMNFGLSDMRLVRPKGDWPNPKAINTSSGAERILEQASIYSTTEQAVADLQHRYATTPRARDMIKTVLSPRELGRTLHENCVLGEKSGVLFGREAKGLHNDDIAISDGIIMVPVNPEHRSLNLAQCVLLVAYEWFQGTAPITITELTRKGGTAASREELFDFFEHLEKELDDCGFLFPPEKRARMVRNIRNIFSRGSLSDQEVKTLRGIVAGLSRQRPRSG